MDKNEALTICKEAQRVYKDALEIGLRYELIHTEEYIKENERQVEFYEILIKALEYKPIDPSFINLDEVKDWNICGYRVEDLLKLALILRDKRIEDYILRDYNQAYLDGYARAREDINKQLEESLNRSIAPFVKEVINKKEG